jgi:flagellar protein FlaF
MAEPLLAGKAYRQAMLATAGPRSIEAEALLRVNGELMRATRRRDADYTAYVRALSRNLDVWNAFAADVAHRDNKLPADVRTKIWRLAAFVRFQTQALLRPASQGDSASLIEINNNIIAGLKAQPETASSAA